MGTVLSSTVAVLVTAPCVAMADDPGWVAGVDLTAETAYGVRGDQRSESTLHGIALLYVDWERPRGDDARIKWSGSASVLGVAGHGPTESFLDDYLAVSNIEAYRSTRLYTWWVQADAMTWSVRAGALLADEEFLVTDAAGGFLNSVFGWPAFISSNVTNTGPAYFVPALGIRFRRAWSDSINWQIGVFDGDTFDSPDGDPSINSDGLHFDLGGDQGLFVISELGLVTAKAKTKLKMGAWFHTADFDDMLVDANGEPFAISGNDPRRYTSDHGTYASIERSLAGFAGEPGSVDVFARIGTSPEDRNPVGQVYDLGIAWTGPIRSRGTDVLSFGLARARFSEDLALDALLEDPSSPAPDFEQVIEASYTLDWSDRLSIQPDLQYIRHPGGSAAQDDALVLLIRVNASF